jgi:hypothetical protein
MSNCHPTIGAGLKINVIKPNSRCNERFQVWNFREEVLCDFKFSAPNQSFNVRELVVSGFHSGVSSSADRLKLPADEVTSWPLWLFSHAMPSAENRSQTIKSGLAAGIFSAFISN